MNIQELNQELSKAKIQLMTKPDSTFYTTVLFSLNFQWDDTQPTAWTDGINIGFNPDFFMKMPKEERVGVLIHEAMHVAYLHMDRLQTREQDIFNQAADHVINLQLLKAGFKLPSFVLKDKRFEGMGTEEVYTILMAEKQQGKPSPQNQMNDLRPGAMPTDQLNQAVQDILVRAAVASKVAGDKVGSIPEHIEIFLNKLLNPKLPWNRITQNYLRKFVKADYSFKKFNRRFFPQHYLPSLHSQGLIDVAIAIDTSGSIRVSDVTRFVTEIHAMFKMMKPTKFTLIQFDTEIKSTTQIRNLQDLMNVEFTGRGGTRIKPVFDWATENKPELLIIFTDGEFDFFNLDSKTDTLWLIHDNKGFKAPFGKVIHYEI